MAYKTRRNFKKTTKKSADFRFRLIFGLCESVFSHLREAYVRKQRKKLHIFLPHRPRFPAQTGQRTRVPFRRKGEREAVGIQCLVCLPRLAIGFVLSVFALADKRISDMGKVRTDLVGPTGEQTHLQ